MSDGGTDGRAVPYWRLSAYYLVYFVSVGTLVPYWSLYLKSQGFSVADIGELMAILVGTKIFAPYMWGWLADHTGKRMVIVRAASLLSVVAFVAIFIRQDFWWLAAVMFLFSFFWNANLPQFEAVTLEYLGGKSHTYTKIRLWGSLGFVFAVLILGSVLEIYGAEILPGIVAVILLSVWLCSLIVSDKGRVAHDEPLASIKSVMTQPVVVAVFVVCFLIQASHGPYYTLYTVYLEDHGYARSYIGLLWALGVIAEIMVFLVVHRWLIKYGPRRLLILTLVLTTIRWVLIGTMVENHAVILLAQFFHAASFGLYHAVAIQLIYYFFPKRLQGRGQALYSSLSFGAGGAVGALFSGYLWDFAGSTATFLLAAILSVVALWVALKYVHISTPKDIAT